VAQIRLQRYRRGPHRQAALPGRHRALARHPGRRLHPRGSQWDREVIDTSLNDGHTILAADLNGDGIDEIVAGFRGQPRSVYIYSYDATTKHWQRSDLGKGAMGAAACAVADLNGDSRPDIACIDGARLKWYENGPQR